MSASVAGLGRVRAAWNLRTSPGRMLSRQPPGPERGRA
jgi:hypothetical protein